MPPLLTCGVNTFRNPQNGHEERVRLPRLWVLLFGALYFAARGMWRPAIWLFLLFIPTVGLAWVYCVIQAPSIVRADYLRRGWAPVT